MDISRELCPLESFYLLPRTRIMLASTARGDLDEKLLAEAFAARVAEHPSLRSRVVTEDGRPAFAPLPPGEEPVLDVAPGGPGALEAEWNNLLPPGGPLIRARLLTDGDEHILVLCADHLVCDGLSIFALQAGIWETYTTLAEGRPLPALDPQPLPPPLSQLLPPISEEDVTAYAERIAADVRQRPVAVLPYEAENGSRPAGDVRVLRVRLDTEATEHLTARLRETGTTVHGLVSAAVLLSVRRELDDAPGPLVLGCSFPVDLRRKLRPKLPPEALTPTVTSCTALLEVDRDTDPLLLAEAVTDHARGFFRRGEYLPQAHVMRHIAQYPELMASSVLSTNVGIIAMPCLPKGLVLTDQQAIAALDNYFPETGQGVVLAASFLFASRLHIDVPYSLNCFSDGQAEGIRRGIEEVLRAYSDRPAGQVSSGVALLGEQVTNAADR